MAPLLVHAAGWHSLEQRLWLAIGEPFSCAVALRLLRLGLARFSAEPGCRDDGMAEKVERGIALLTRSGRDVISRCLRN